MPPTFEPRRFYEEGREVYPAEHARRRVNQRGPVILEDDDGRLTSLHRLVGEFLDKSEFFLHPDPDYQSSIRLAGAVPQVVSNRPWQLNERESGYPSLISRISWAKTGLDLLRYQSQAGFVSLGLDSRHYRYAPQDFIDEFGMTPEEGNAFLDGISRRGVDSGLLFPRRSVRSTYPPNGERYSLFSTPVSVVELEQEERRIRRGKGEVVLAALGGMGIVSVLASACVPVQIEPTGQPTVFPSATPRPTERPTPKPFSLIEATPTVEVRPFTPPINPPEYDPQAAGGAFPEGIRAVAELDYYRALETLYRQEVGSFLTANLAEYQQFLTTYARQNNLDVRQVWNSQFGNDYQMVSAIIKRLSGGRESVYWYATPGGALSARPDVPSVVNSNLVSVELQQGTHADFRWNNEDRNIYLFEVDNSTGEAVSWLNTTTANAASSEGLVQAFESYVREVMPTTGLDPVVNANVGEQFLLDKGFRSMKDALADVNTTSFVAGLSMVGSGERLFFRQMWYMSQKMKIIGGYQLSLANQPGYREGDSAYCLLGASPDTPDMVVPIILGVEQNGIWTQAQPLFTEGLRSDVPGSLIRLSNLAEIDDWVQNSRGKVIMPLILLRYDKTTWDRDPSWNIGYDVVLPLLKNPNGYIMRYTNAPSELGAKISRPDGSDWGEQANLIRVISELNNNFGGDIGLIAWQITVLK